MSPDPYEVLFRELRVGPVVVPNRIVRTSHQTGLARNGIGDDLIAYHRRRAEDGVGLTVLERGGVHISDPASISLVDDSIVAGYERLRHALAHCPMRVFQQLGHAGNFAQNGRSDARWAPSGVPPFFWLGRPAPIAMTLAQIDELVEAYAAAARRVLEGGLDGVEIHAGHGLLVAQFLSPLTNHREDTYGGSPENRRRFLLDILTAVRSTVGRSLAVGVRLSADEEVPGGTGVLDAIATIRALEQRELIDFVDLSVGSDYSYHRVIGGMEEPHGYQLPKTLPAAAAASVPTIVAGRIKTLDHAAELVRSGVTDLVSIVRAYIAEPDLIKRTRLGGTKRVRPCIGCNQGCVGGNATDGRIGCTVNAHAGREATADLPTRAANRRHVLVIGGGPAGLETARVAAERGHEVLLCEKELALGGQVSLARRAPHRSEIGAIIDWLVEELARLRVEVRTGINVTHDVVADVSPDAMVVATGCKPRAAAYQAASPTIPIQGMELPHVRNSRAVLAGEVGAPERAVVYDDVGHYEAASVCESLLDHGATVTLVTRHSRLAPLLEPARATTPLRHRLAGRKFSLVPDSALEVITNGGVVVRSLFGGPSMMLDADCVVPVLQYEGDAALVTELESLGIELHVVGDAIAQRFLQTAIADGTACGARL